jgi:hypothetical protein
MNPSYNRLYQNISYVYNSLEKYSLKEEGCQVWDWFFNVWWYCNEPTSAKYMIG